MYAIKITSIPPAYVLFRGTANKSGRPRWRSVPDPAKASCWHTPEAAARNLRALRALSPGLAGDFAVVEVPS